MTRERAVTVSYALQLRPFAQSVSIQIALE